MMRWADRQGQRHGRAIRRWLAGSGGSRRRRSDWSPRGAPLEQREVAEVHRSVHGDIPGKWEIQSYRGGDYCYSKQEGGYEINIYVEATGQQYQAWQIGSVDFVRLDTGEVIHSEIPEERWDVQAAQSKAWRDLRQALEQLGC